MLTKKKRERREKESKRPREREREGKQTEKILGWFCVSFWVRKVWKSSGELEEKN